MSNRVKLSKRHQEALAMFSNEPKDDTEVDRDEDELLDELDSDEAEAEAFDETDSESEQEADEESSDDVDDSSWIDELTSLEQPAPPQEQETQSVPEQAPSTEQHAGESDDEYIERMRATFADLEHIDDDVANEILDKTVKPLVDHRFAETDSEVKRLRDEVNHLQAERAAKRFEDINSPILAKYPKAQQILASKEFVEFVNKNSNPYASETNFMVLQRAYRSGDSGYVIKALDEFANSRKKPKPSVSVDTAGNSTTSQTKRTKRMSEQEFLDKRRAMMANPRKYPKGALRELEYNFFNQK